MQLGDSFANATLQILFKLIHAAQLTQPQMQMEVEIAFVMLIILVLVRVLQQQFVLLRLTAQQALQQVSTI